MGRHGTDGWQRALRRAGAVRSRAEPSPRGSGAERGGAVDRSAAQLVQVPPPLHVARRRAG